MWWYSHSSVRAIGLIDLAPAPAGLEDRAADADLAHVVGLEVAVGDLADIVRLAEGPPLELHHRPHNSAITSAYHARTGPRPEGALPREIREEITPPCMTRPIPAQKKPRAKETVCGRCWTSRRRRMGQLCLHLVNRHPER